MEENTRTLRVHPNYFKGESIEPGTDLDELRYLGRGEKRYGISRQLISRNCHDALVAYDNNGQSEKGILLIRRNAEPAKGYLWPLGGFFDRGVPISGNPNGLGSLASRIKGESGLDIDLDTLVGLGDVRFLWKTTPYKPTDVSPKIYDFISGQDMSNITLQEALRLLQEMGLGEHISGRSLQSFADLIEEKNLPKGIDDFGNLFYAEGNGELKLDFLHKDPLIVTQEMYTEGFRQELHSYVREGMDRAIPLL